MDKGKMHLQTWYSFIHGLFCSNVYNFGVLMGFIPLDALLKGHPRTTKDIQGTANGQVNFAFATNMYLFEVL